MPKSWTVFDLAVQSPAAAFMTLLEKTGSSDAIGLPLLRGATSHLTSGVQDVRRTDVRLGTVPGLELTYSESKPAVGTLYGAQFDALPVGGTLCVINLYAMGGLPAGVISEITRTVQYL